MEHKNNVREHFHCVKHMLELYKTQNQLANLAKREDLDSVCAFDYARMKAHALNGGLSYADFNPSINIPKLE